MRFRKHYFGGPFEASMLVLTEAQLLKHDFPFSRTHTHKIIYFIECPPTPKNISGTSRSKDWRRALRTIEGVVAAQHINFDSTIWQSAKPNLGRCRTILGKAVFCVKDWCSPKQTKPKHGPFVSRFEEIGVLF